MTGSVLKHRRLTVKTIFVTSMSHLNMYFDFDEHAGNYAIIAGGELLISCLINEGVLILPTGSEISKEICI